jgi:enoyl-CoA hydratase/carnithine racemase
LEWFGRSRALEVLLSSEDIRGDQAEACGYVNRALPNAELDAFVGALATRIAGFDKRAIANISAWSTPAYRGTWSSAPVG